MIHNLLAVSLILGWILSLVGPGASATNSSMPPMPNNGRMAIVSTMMPIPPIHWVILLQNKILFGKDSMLSKIEAPVVVKPDMVSKNALVKEGILPVNKYGSDPNKLIHNQPPTTIKYPSLFLISAFLSSLVRNRRRNPKNMFTH